MRNFPFDFTRKTLKDKVNECVHMLYTDIRMENRKVKEYHVVKCESPEWLRKPAG